MVKEINSVEEFDQEIKKDRVLVDMSAIWCGPCQALAPIIEEFSNEHNEINVIGVDVDKLDEIASRFQVMSIPTLLYIEKGELKNKSIGYISKDSIEKLCKIL